MTVESVTNISDLNPSYPATDDDLNEGDNHIRNLKTALQTDFGQDDTAAGTLHIFGDGTGSTSGGAIRLYMAADHDGTDDYYTIDVSSDDLRINREGETADFTLAANGRVGIGETAPSALLHITGSDNPLRIENAGGNTWDFEFDGNSLKFDYNGGVKFNIDPDGNVFGTTGTTGMTNGFVFIPAAAGAPSGTPGIGTTTLAAMYFDTSNKKFYCYNHVANAWEGVTLS